MVANKAVIWSLINGEVHPSIEEEVSFKLSDLVPIEEAMFPGIDYFGTSGFYEVMTKLVIPALQTIFPELVGMPTAEVSGNCDIPLVLACDGYEWVQPEWQASFEQILNRR